MKKGRRNGIKIRSLIIHRLSSIIQVLERHYEPSNAKISNWLTKRVDGARHLVILRLVEDDGQSALAAVLSVRVRGHEDAGAALFVAALLSLSGDLVVLIDL